MFLLADLSKSKYFDIHFDMFFLSFLEHTQSSYAVLPVTALNPHQGDPWFGAGLFRSVSAPKKGTAMIK